MFPSFFSRANKIVQLIFLFTINCEDFIDIIETVMTALTVENRICAGESCCRYFEGETMVIDGLKYFVSCKRINY